MDEKGPKFIVLGLKVSNYYFGPFLSIIVLGLKVSNYYFCPLLQTCAHKETSGDVIKETYSANRSNYT
jgi:hypothetical protein